MKSYNLNPFARLKLGCFSKSQKPQKKSNKSISKPIRLDSESVGNFTLIKKIGTGAYASVFLAETSTKEKVAVKLWDDDLTKTDKE